MSAKVNCPQCMTPTENDFGVVICENCGAVYSIDIAGNAVLTAANQATQVLNLNNPQPPPPPPEPEPVKEEIQIPEGTVVFGDQAVEAPIIAELAYNEPEPPPPPEPQPTPVKLYQPIENLELRPLPDFEESLSAANFKDVEKAAQAPDTMGPEIYSLKIQGFQDPKIKAAIEETLLDPKFNFDVQNIKKSLQQNQVELHHLNLVKLKVLVNKLKSYSVQMSWTQTSV